MQVQVLGDRESLIKANLDKGYILYLREDCYQIDKEAYKRSGLKNGNLGHPVLIIDMLGDNHEFVWVLQVRRSTQFRVVTPL